jgi:tripartite-type tricarboxylate transporter receptor subunit TctC
MSVIRAMRANALARLLSAGILIALSVSAAAQLDYPNKPIRFISPNTPGGGTTILARLVSQKLTERLGQQVIIENRPGGNGIIGGEFVAKSAPDGYTLMSITGAHITIPLLIRTPYDPIKDFSAVATIASYELVLVVHPGVPANNLQQFIALAKARPGKLNYATSSTGTSSHLTIELLSMRTGIRMQHIPYKGSGPALADLIGGQVDLTVIAPSSAMQHIKNGLLKAIAVSGDARLPALPQVATFTESGLPGFDVKGWYGLVAPAGAPKEIIGKLSTEVANILAMPDIREKIVGMGLTPFISTPEQFAELMKADMVTWGKVIREANITLAE